MNAPPKPPIPAAPPPPAFAACFKSVVGGLLVLPYALKSGALVTSPIAFEAVEDLVDWFVPEPNRWMASACLAVPELLVLTALASGNPGCMRRLRLVSFWVDMALAAFLFCVGARLFARGSRGDEMGFLFLGIAIPLAVVTLLKLIPFRAERTEPS